MDFHEFHPFLAARIKSLLIFFNLHNSKVGLFWAKLTKITKSKLFIQNNLLKCNSVHNFESIFDYLQPEEVKNVSKIVFKITIERCKDQYSIQSIAFEQSKI